ncbi:MAG TPA: membrane protein insertase YidC [bacterium]|nr:membrane protein insertase YidC [bacterium]
MDKNFLIAVILMSVIVLLFMSPQYQQRFGRDLPPKPAVEQTVRKSTEKFPSLISKEKPGITGLSTKPAEDAVEPSAIRPEETDKAIQINATAKAQEFTLGNDDIEIQFSTRGGIITKATMKNFRGRDKTELAQLVTEGEAWYSGRIVDGDFELNISDIIFSRERVSIRSVELHAEITGDRRITRTFALDEQGFMLHAGSSLSGDWDNPELHFNWHGPVNTTEAKNKKLRIWPLSLLMRDDSTAYDKIAYLGQGDRTTFNNGKEEKLQRVYSNESSQKIDARKSKMGGQDFFIGDLNWYAVRNKYFMTAAIPKEKMRWKAAAAYSMVQGIKWYDFSISKNLSDGVTDLDIYIGPIAYDTLKSYNENLTELMELSWRFIRPLSIVFLWLFKKFHAVIPNWGLVIVAFSIFIKIVLFPLSHKSFVSMRKMSALQPQIAELREKYKNNTQKLHQATMELYKKEGVNPFGGCLPMLFQMPVFFAMYPVVGRSFELRQAMFIPNWIEDLSRPDPYYILPIAMGISMFVQQKLTMTDPNQKAMLYIMPVMMIFLFANFSSGLTLYWFLFNVLSYMQQTIHKRK